ncbi:hypothetical protein ACJQWK_01025 [Exserohilum turcicum]|uniref:Uncharacterized protein n=1 Tax=Exserohilum turcicum (strain 28A) TaxID=671987 RepID=R0JSI4_EXST2|nr:uncharacterized protein SETTUDRAFT_180158 [Exserohilum turcica Et28A]EOA84048.1 hypothetical protein SETTUDRAFT_180158 [Exserohilum turcica Et28A]
MHPSTVAAILAFTAGMTHAAPALGPALFLPNTQPTKLRTTLGKARVDSNLDEVIDDVEIKSAAKRDSKNSRLRNVGSEPNALGRIAYDDPLMILEQQQLPEAKNSVAKRNSQSGKDEFQNNLTGRPVTLTPELLEILNRHQPSTVKRDPQRVAKGRNGEPVYFYDDVLTVSQKESAEKRDPEARRRLDRISDAIDVGTGAIGLVTDGINLGKTIAGSQKVAKRDPQRRSRFRDGNAYLAVEREPSPLPASVQHAPVKRDPQRRNKGHIVGNVLEGGAGAIGVFSDILGIHQAVNPAPAKRDPQRRNKGHIAGNIGEAIAGTIGAASDILNIHQTVNPAPAKRDPQRRGGSKLRNFGKGIEAGFDTIGAIGDLGNIIGATQPQPAKREPARKLRNFGKGIEAGFDTIGAIGDLGNIIGATQPQPAKREPARKLRNFGKGLQAGFDTIGAIGDLGNIIGATQPQPAKREPVGKLRNFGKGLEAGAGAIGFVGDLINIGGAVQPAKREVSNELDNSDEDIEAGATEHTGDFVKRDPQRRGKNYFISNTVEGKDRPFGDVNEFIGIDPTIQGQHAKREPAGKFRNFGKGLEAGAGAIGVVGDLIGIGGAVQGQHAKRELQQGEAEHADDVSDIPAHHELELCTESSDSTCDSTLAAETEE